jgi:hypothetical protein
MAEIKEFVINDRRKFTAEGDLRPDAPPSEPKVAAPLPVESEARLIPESEHRPDTSAASSGPHLVGGAEGMDADEVGAGDEAMPPPPTMEQIDQAKRAYDATIDRLDTAIRATNPGIDRMPPMSFDRVVQSIYMPPDNSHRSTFWVHARPSTCWWFWRRRRAQTSLRLRTACCRALCSNSGLHSLRSRKPSLARLLNGSPVPREPACRVRACLPSPVDRASFDNSAVVFRSLDFLKLLRCKHSFMNDLEKIASLLL